MTKSEMHNIVTLIKRLEAVASRLEDIASSPHIFLPPNAIPNEYTNPTLPIESTTRPSSSQPIQATEPDADVASRPPESVEAFDLFLKTAVGNYHALSQELGGVISDQASIIVRGFEAHRFFIIATTKALKPATDSSDRAAYDEILKPSLEALEHARDMQQSNRHSPEFDFLTTVADGALVLAWPTVQNRPWLHVEEAASCAHYFGNKILAKETNKESLRARWVKSFYVIFDELIAHLREHCPYGIVWNGKEELKQVVKALMER